MTDLFGKEVEVGSIVVLARRRRTHPDLVIGYVKRFSDKSAVVGHSYNETRPIPFNNGKELVVITHDMLTEKQKLELQQFIHKLGSKR